jgi:hypothetical protein
VLQGERVMGYAVEAKAALPDPQWDLLPPDGIAMAGAGDGGFWAGVPVTLENAEGMRYHSSRIRAVVEKP